MTGQQRDQESTQVGMPVPPTAPGYAPTASGYAGPPGGYGQAPPGYEPAPPPGYTPPPPGYGAPPGGYPPPPADYGYASAPPPRRGGVLPVLIGVLALLVVVAAGVVGLYVAKLGPFAPAANPTATLTGQQTPTPSLAPATATPSAAPTTAPPTASPTAPPTTPPTTAPPPTASPTTPASVSPSSAAAGEAVLRSHVPSEFVDTCVTSPSTAPAIASLMCTANEGTIVANYTLYPDATSMNDAYDFERQLFAPDAGSDTCETSTNWPSDYQYTIAGDPSGHVFCADLGEIPQMYWTDTRFNILSWSLFAVAGTRDDMYAFWRDDSGPY